MQYFPVRGTKIFLSRKGRTGNEGFPRQEDLELVALHELPDTARDRTQEADTEEEQQDLKQSHQDRFYIAASLRATSSCDHMLFTWSRCTRRLIAVTVPTQWCTSWTYPNNQDVHEAVDVSALELCHSTVHHQLRVLAGEDYQPIAPLRVSQNATCKFMYSTCII